MSANLTLIVLDAIDSLTSAYWLPITITLAAILLVVCGDYLKGDYLKSCRYIKHIPETKVRMWVYGGLLALFIIFVFTLKFMLNHEPEPKNAMFVFFGIIIAYLILIIISLGPSIVSECINWMKERDLRNLALNLSNKWFDWVKWTTIIAPISYIQVQTSDEILKIIVTISYLVLLINIISHLLPIFKGLFNRTPAFESEAIVYIILINVYIFLLGIFFRYYHLNIFYN